MNEQDTTFVKRLASRLEDDIPLMDDRTGSEIDDDCGMKYWWTRHQDGAGIVPVNEPVYFQQGRLLHQDMEAIARAQDPVVWLQEQLEERLQDSKLPKEQVPMEILYRHLGWLAGWALYLEPRIRHRYETLQIEHELILESPSGKMWVPIIPDRVLREKKDRKIIYKEFKTTIQASQKWQSSWSYQPQLHLGQLAIEQELGEPVAYAQIIGILKGTYYTNAEHFTKLTHPYVWAYYNARTHEWTSEYRQSSGWEARPVWEYPGGILEWVRFLGGEIALGQFPHSVAVFKNDRFIHNWFLRREARQTEIEEVKDRCRENLDARNVYFEMRTKHCEPAYGEKCPYLMACWNAEIGEDPLGTGLYVKRDPHHETERLLMVKKGLIKE